ncbi:hypothetical protein N7535_007901 [Penicillium sp. DV-2018c]|nr:hypothetical protein N7461_003935 [Penicillium sp. DV-2018c]KAJ5566263.1 hypothetical protein N7535_007901 [Penicillium sp. DV-2018c]
MDNSHRRGVLARSYNILEVNNAGVHGVLLLLRNSTSTPIDDPEEASQFDPLMPPLSPLANQDIVITGDTVVDYNSLVQCRITFSPEFARQFDYSLHLAFGPSSVFPA